MNTVLKIVVSIAGVLAALASIGWLGLQVPSKLVVPVTGKSQTLGGVDIPENLPAPVLRYLHVALGEVGAHRAGLERGLCRRHPQYRDPGAALAGAAPDQLVRSVVRRL